MTLQEDILRNIVVVRCLREWIGAEIAKGIVVDAPEAIEMHTLMEKVIRTYQEELAAAAAAAAAAGSRTV